MCILTDTNQNIIIIIYMYPQPRFTVQSVTSIFFLEITGPSIAFTYSNLRHQCHHEDKHFSWHLQCERYAELSAVCIRKNLCQTSLHLAAFFRSD